VVQDWADAMRRLKGRVSGALYSELLNLGPGAVDQIVALANNDSALASYAEAWQAKYNIAGAMGAESVRAAQQVDQLIEKQVNTFNITNADPNAVANIVITKLRVAGYA
jgi:hypothetical protein